MLINLLFFIDKFSHFVIDYFNVDFLRVLIIPVL